MERVIADVLEVARTRAGGAIPVERAPVRLDELARAAAEELAVASGAGVELVVEGDCALSGDAPRLTQLVSNLCQQAHRHGAAGAPARARLVGGPEEVMLEVEVEGLGAGAGRPGSALRALPARASATRCAGTLGLGLFIVREIARAHGGAVRVVPAGAVTLFQVVLPRR